MYYYRLLSIGADEFNKIMLNLYVLGVKFIMFSKPDPDMESISVMFAVPYNEAYKLNSPTPVLPTSVSSDGKTFHGHNMEEVYVEEIQEFSREFFGMEI